MAIPLGMVLSMTLCIADQTTDERPTEPNDDGKCTALLKLKLETLESGPAKIGSATLIHAPRGLEEPPASAGVQPINRMAVATYCQVNGYVGAQSHFELRLPMAEQWNEKFFFSACAGFCGVVNGNACNLGLAKGYASVTSNGGHRGTGGSNAYNIFDAVWAYNNVPIQEDFGFRSNHAVTVATKRITEAYYGRKIARSYISGCSKGGQAGLAAAQRFPADFDGAIVGAPVIDYTDKIVIHGAWTAQANTDKHGRQIVGGREVAMVHEAVMAACDALDGVKDGLLTDPRQCTWQPIELRCERGRKPPSCLTAAQVTALNKLYSPPTNSKGTVLFPAGLTKGSENKWGGGVYTPEGMTDLPTGYVSYFMTQQSLRYLASEDGSADYRHDDPLTFDFDSDPARLDRARSIYDSSSVDLKEFKRRGGKILVWHGWADHAIPAGASIAYYDRLTAFLGGKAQVDDFFRMFLLPGVYHCSGGPGPAQFDALEILETWAEDGQAPDTIITSHAAEGRPDRSRPVYPYPLVPTYKGSGSIDDAASFHPSANL